MHLFLYPGAAWDPCIPELSAWARDLAQLPIPLPANAHLGAAADGSSRWVLVTHMGDPNGAPGSWPGPGPALTAADIWGVN